MKIRNGFVSNSSSSSFIATYGKVVDNNRFDKWLDKCKYSRNYTIVSGEKLIELQEQGGRWSHPITSGFMDCMIDEKKVLELAKNNPESTFIFKTGTGPTGDGDFMTGEDEDSYDLNYDIELDRFDPDDVELYDSSIGFNGVEIIEQTYYAGRNG